MAQPTAQHWLLLRQAWAVLSALPLLACADCADRPAGTPYRLTKEAKRNLLDVLQTTCAGLKAVLPAQIDLPGTPYRLAKEAKRNLLDILRPNVQAAIADLEAGQWASIKRRSAVQVHSLHAGGHSTCWAALAPLLPKVLHLTAAAKHVWDCNRAWRMQLPMTCSKPCEACVQKQCAHARLTCCSSASCHSGRDDVLQNYLYLSQQEGQPLNASAVADLVLNLMVAGYDTTAWCVVSHAFL